MRFSLAELASATDGSVVGDDETTVGGVTIDSRQAAPGELFVPLVADRDGHDFIGAARANGAVAHLTSRNADEPAPRLVVADTAAALTAIGRAARQRLGGPVVAITGSVGKTSAKDLLAAVLTTELRCWASRGSFNNELGVPLTLANAPDDTQVSVVEMGARGLGHIAELCAVASPTVGIVTRVAAVHTSEFDHVDQIAVAKGELVEALPADGLAVLNADDERVRAMASRTEADVATYGLTGGEVRAEDVSVGDDLRPTFTLVTPSERLEIHLGVAGAHQVSNALAAATAAIHLGVGLPSVANGLAAATLSAWRMETSRSPSGALIVNDAYNANPTSMLAAFDALAAAPADRRIAVLGHMAELGADSDAEHRRIGAEARDRGFELIEFGADYGADVSAADVGSVIDAIGPTDERTAVLVKASRSAGLEAVAEALLS